MWAGAALFFAALLSQDILEDAPQIIILLGAGMAFFAFILKRWAPSVGKASIGFFMSQAANCLMLIGKACIFSGVFDFFSIAQGQSQLLTGAFLIMISTYFIFDSYADRFLCSIFFFGMLFLFSGGFYMHSGWMINLSQETLAAWGFVLTALIFIKRASLFYPIAWALIAAMCSVPVMQIETAKGTAYTAVLFNDNKLLIVAFMAACAAVHIHLTAAFNKRNLAAVCIFILCCLPFNIPVLMGAGYLFLGVFFRDLRLKILGYAVLAGGLLFLYYSLHITLIEKAWLLMTSGLVFLGVRFVLGRVYEE